MDADFRRRPAFPICVHLRLSAVNKMVTARVDPAEAKVYFGRTFFWSDFGSRRANVFVLGFNSCGVSLISFQPSAFSLSSERGQRLLRIRWDGRPARANRATDTRARRPCHYRLKTRLPKSNAKHLRGPKAAVAGTKNLQTPPKRRMKASSNSSRNRFRNWPHPSLGRRSWSRTRETGRAQPNRYPDFGPPTSLPPSRSRKRETSGCGSL